MSEYTDWLRRTFGDDGLLLMQLDAMADSGRIFVGYPREKLDAARAELRRRIAERKAAEKRRGGEK